MVAPRIHSGSNGCFGIEKGSSEDRGSVGPAPFIALKARSRRGSAVQSSDGPHDRSFPGSPLPRTTSAAFIQRCSASSLIAEARDPHPSASSQSVASIAKSHSVSRPMERLLRFDEPTAEYVVHDDELGVDEDFVLAMTSWHDRVIDAQTVKPVRRA